MDIVVTKSKEPIVKGGLNRFNLPKACGPNIAPIATTIEPTTIQEKTIQVSQTQAKIKEQQVQNIAGLNNLQFCLLFKQIIVTDIIDMVDQEFRKRSGEISYLCERVQEKERELQACEFETKKQQDNLSILISAKAFRSHTFDQLKEIFSSFQQRWLYPLRKLHPELLQSIQDGKYFVSHAFDS